MTLSDLRTGIQSLNSPYREVADRLGIEDPAAYERFMDVLLIWSDALSEDYAFLSTYEESILHGEKPIKDHAEAVEQLGAALKNLDGKNIVLWSGYLLNTIRQYVSKVGQTTLDRSGRYESEGRKEEAVQARNDRRKAKLLETRIEQAELSQHLRAAVAHANTMVRQVEAAAASAQTAAGFVSGANLTKRFSVLSKDQLRTALVFRVLTVIGVLCGVVGTFLIAVEPAFSHGTETTTGDAILRVSLLGAVLGLATYFGRQAGYHRDQGTWARTIKEQLLTFDGYVEPLTDQELKDHLRAAFASRVFGSSPESKDDPGVTLGSSFMSDLLAAAGKSAKP